MEKTATQVPETEKKQCKCPFYGFSLVGEPIKVLMDSKGNQCALIIGSHSPCKMEIQQKPIDWNICPISTENIHSAIERIMDEYTIFPDKLEPEGAGDWNGIKFRQWYEYIMYGKPINPKGYEETPVIVVT